MYDLEQQCVFQKKKLLKFYSTFLLIAEQQSADLVFVFFVQHECFLIG